MLIVAMMTKLAGMPIIDRSVTSVATTSSSTTTAAPTGGPNPPNPMRIDCVHDASSPVAATTPWTTHVKAYVISRNDARRWRSIHDRTGGWRVACAGSVIRSPPSVRSSSLVVWRSHAPSHRSRH